MSCVHSLLYLQLGYEGEPLAGQRCVAVLEMKTGPAEPSLVAREGLAHPTCPSAFQASRETTGMTWLSSSLSLRMALVHP